MTPPLDILERAAIAVVAVIRANADIKALTGRENGNIIEWNPESATDDDEATAELPTLPIIAYRIVVASPGGGINDTQSIPFVFSAVAATASIANELLWVLQRKIVWSVALATLPTPLDAYFTNPVRRPIPWDTDEDAARSDLEFTLIVTP